jgi:hypothetical protein
MKGDEYPLGPYKPTRKIGNWEKSVKDKNNPLEGPK